jgi:predicted AAA+ superfamily ATPase
MILRKGYIDKLKKFQDTQLIKVITGIRRCGKSTLLDQFSHYLQDAGVDDAQIISINFEDLRYENLLNYQDLYAHISGRLVEGKKTYIFLDEIQRVDQFEKAVDSLFIKPGVDLYITGSNAFLLSGELSTLLSGRYVEINILPLSFKEYHELVGGDERDTFTQFLSEGGFPYAATIKDDMARLDYLRGIYSTVLLKDLVERRKIADATLLERVIRFLFDNTGFTVSPKRISDSLTSAGRKTSHITIENYLAALADAYMLYKVSRYDVRGRQHLKTLEKYYLVDQGFRLLMVGKMRDYGFILENIVYLELLRRDYQIFVGKVGDAEIDFIAIKGNEKAYFQVTYLLASEETIRREFTPLEAVRDNYPKYILSMDDFDMSRKGIIHRNIRKWLME